MKTEKLNRAWFERKVSELGQAAEGLSEHPKEQFLGR